MKKTIFEIYALTVCFAAVLCFVITFGILLNQTVRIANPEFTLSSYEHEKHIDNDQYWKSVKPSCDEEDEKADCCKNNPRPAEDELTKQREASYQKELNAEVRDAKQTLVTNLIVVILSLLVFLSHWVLARRSRETPTPH